MPDKARPTGKSHFLLNCKNRDTTGSKGYSD